MNIALLVERGGGQRKLASGISIVFVVQEEFEIVFVIATVRGYRTCEVSP